MMSLLLPFPASTLLDAGGPVLLLAIFGVGGLVAIVVIFVIEAIVLVLMKWAPLGRSVLDAILMNLASTLVGLIGICGLFTLPLGGSNLDFTGGIIFLVVTFIVSVVVEALVLTWLRRHPPRQTWLTSLVANGVSYVALLTLLVLAYGGIIRL
jgi:hypothetical protein